MYVGGGLGGLCSAQRLMRHLSDGPGTIRMRHTAIVPTAPNDNAHRVYKNRRKSVTFKNNKTLY